MIGKMNPTSSLSDTMHERLRIMYEAELAVEDSINEILETHREKLLMGFQNWEINGENLKVVAKRLFDFFFFEKLYLFEQNEWCKVGVIKGIEEYSYVFRGINNGYLVIDDLIDRAKKYFDSFNIFEYIDINNQYAVEIVQTNQESTYKQRIYEAALRSRMDGTSEDIARNIICNIVDEYYFNEILTEEERIAEKERHRQENYIPDFSDVHEGQCWYGRNRIAEFIRALRLEPKPAGKNSRKAQEKSIARSCEYMDDKDNQVLTLVEIFPARLPKSRKERTRKYETDVRLLLLDKLKDSEDNNLKTTKPKLLLEIGVLPYTFKKIPSSFYAEKLPPELRVSESILENDLKHFRGIAQERLNDIIQPVLENLVLKKTIHLDTYSVVAAINTVGQKVYASVYNSDEIGLRPEDLVDRLKEAEKWAANQIVVEVYDTDSRRKKRIRLEDISDVYRYWKLSQYREYYDKYISDKFGWMYVFEQLDIMLDYRHRNTEIKQTEVLEATRRLNRMLVDAVGHTIKTKYENREKAYQKAYSEEYKARMDDEEIRYFHELGLYSEDDIEKFVNVFRYSKGFLERAKMFARYELALDVKAQKEYIVWESKHPN